MPQYSVFSKGDNLYTVSIRSEEHTSELQSLRHLVCRLLLEKKNVLNASPRAYFPSTATLQAFATRNFTTRLAGILRGLPVCGLRPIRAFRFTKTRLPRPGNVKVFLASL